MWRILILIRHTSDFILETNLKPNQMRAGDNGAVIAVLPIERLRTVTENKLPQKQIFHSRHTE